MVDGDSMANLVAEIVHCGDLIAGDDLVTWIDTNGDRLIQYRGSGYERSGFDYLINTTGTDCEDLHSSAPAEGESPLEGEHPWKEEPQWKGEPHPL